MNKENLERIFNDDLGTSYFPYLAEEYIQDGNYDLAQKVCDIGILLNPYNNDGKFILAKILMLNGETTYANKLLKQILKSDSMYVNAMKMLVLSYQKDQKNHIELMKLIHKILDLIPDDKFANNILKPEKKPPRVLSIKNITPSLSRKAKTIKKKSITRPNKKKDKKLETDLDIDPKMATLTFIDILIKQKQFIQADSVLKKVRENKTISRDSIAKRQKKIKAYLSKEN